MNNIKRIISIGMVVLLTLALTVTVMAEDVPTVTVSSVTNAEPGQTINVDIDMSNNPGILTMGLYVRWDEHLTLTEFVGTETIPYAMVGTGEEYYEGTPAEYELDEGVEPWPDYYYKYYMFLGDGTARANNNNNGTVATLKFKVPNDAVAGTKYPIDVFVNKIDTLNYNRQQVEFTGVSGGITVKSAEPTTYTVTYNANGGTTDATPATVEANGAADLTKIASKDGYTFLGWNTDKDAKTKLDSYTVTGNVTLYAIYEENPVPTGPVLNGVATRLASSVAIDNVNHTVNIVYDTAQTIYVSSYVGFAPIVGDGVEVTYSGADFREKVARLANYTVTTGSEANIDLLAEKTDKTKEAIDGYIYYLAGNAGVHSFDMILTDGNLSTNYAVNIRLADLATEGNVITEEMAKTEGFYKAGRTSDIVDIDTAKKVITLTTKNVYNFTTFGLNAVALTGIETANARPRRTIEVVEADNNIKHTVFSNSNLYDRGVLISYNEGETKECTLKIYGGENGMSYETYTLIVNYVPNVDTSTITILRVQAVENARANKAAEINEDSEINVTYDAAYDNEGFAIKFVPILRRGLTGEFIGGKGDTATFPVCGAERPMYVIDDINDVDSFTYRVKYFRDYRDFDVNFIPKA